MSKGKRQSNPLEPRRLSLDDVEEVDEVEEKKEEEEAKDPFIGRRSGMYLPVGEISDNEYRTLDQFPGSLDEQLKESKFEEEDDEDENEGMFSLQVDDNVEQAKDQIVEQSSGFQPWKPGQSGNPRGRPRGAKNTLRQVGERIAGSRAYGLLSVKQRNLAKSMGFNANEITIIEALMLNLATSANPNKIALFLERTYGKVPNINLNAQINENLIVRFRSKLTDSELEEVANGADVLELLLSKLPDADDSGESGVIIDAETR